MRGRQEALNERGEDQRRRLSERVKLCVVAARRRDKRRSARLARRLQVGEQDALDYAACVVPS